MKNRKMIRKKYIIKQIISNVIIGVSLFSLCGCGSDTTGTLSNETSRLTYNEEIVIDRDSSVSDGLNSTIPESFMNVSGTISRTELDENTSHFVCDFLTKDKVMPMKFSFDGDSRLGQVVAASYSNTFLYDADEKYELCAWFGGTIEEGRFKYNLEMEEEDWLNNSHLPYNRDYIVIDKQETSINVILSIETEMGKGYGRFMIDKDRELCYQFTYIEPYDEYDDERAFAVINSIEFVD